jgi:tetratricopeptide (TPR) repeat protein
MLNGMLSSKQIVVAYRSTKMPKYMIATIATGLMDFFPVVIMVAVVSVKMMPALSQTPAAKLNTKTIADYVQEGDEWIRQKRNQDAIAAYQKAVSLLSNQQNAYDLFMKLGSLWVKQNNVAEALKAFTQGHAILRKLNPTDYPQQIPLSVYAHGSVAQELLAQNKQGAALDAYRQAVALNPDLNAKPESTQKAWVFLYLGEELKLKQNLAAATSAYRQAIALDPNLEAALDALGALLQQQNQIEEAIALYRRWINLNPQSQIAKQSLANAEQLLQQRSR